MPENQTKIYTYLKVIFLNLVLASVLLWLISQVFSVSAGNDKLNQDLKILEVKKNNFSQLKNEFTKQENSLKMLDGFFVQPDQKVEVIEFLEKIAQKAKVGYSLNAIDDKNGLALDLTARGTFKDVYYFLKLVETSGYWVTFDKASFARQAGEKDIWSESMTIFIPAAIK